MNALPLVPTRFLKRVLGRAGKSGVTSGAGGGVRAERIGFGLRSVWMRSASDLWDVAVACGTPRGSGPSGVDVAMRGFCATIEKRRAFDM